MTNIGNPDVTPDPAIHNLPPADNPAAEIGSGQIVAWGEFFLESFIAAVAIALGNVSILGIRPLAFLTAWGEALENQASQAFEAATNAQTTATAATTTQAQQSTAKPGYLAMDATADAVFPIAQISGATPTVVAVSNADSVIGMINTPDNGKKSSVVWLGKDTTGITGFHINIYQIDTTTGIAYLLEASPDISGAVTNILSWNYYDLINPITSQVGNWYAVELVVAGSGTYHVAGLPNHWLPANSVAFPQQMGATRDVTGGITAPSSFTPTGSQDVPWFGLGGFLFAGPSTSVYTIAGVHTYTIPTWMKWGDNIDIIALGAGGGGENSSFYLTGQGGNPGNWTTRTVVYGVDIPTSTTTLAVDVGAGGSGGSGLFGPGHTGGDSTVTGTGLTTVTGAGGGGGISGPHAGGPGPGNQVFHTVTYTGGGAAGASDDGHSPGGAGGGGGPYDSGGAGAPGAVWLVAYQAGTTP